MALEVTVNSLFCCLFCSDPLVAEDAFGWVRHYKLEG